ncbi:GDSL-type esterase/lipase family protein [Lachnospiraceae bacterium ZAX-1]
MNQNKSMNWKKSWEYLPLDFCSVPFTVEDEQQTILIPNNICGNAVRIKLSNKCGTQPLAFEAVSLGGAQPLAFEPISLECARPLFFTFSKERAVTLQPGEERFSDELACPISCERELSITTYVKNRTRIDCACIFCTPLAAKVECYKASTGEVVDMHRSMTANDERCIVCYGLACVEILSAGKVKTIAAFGDSITHMSFWTAPLQQRLCKEYAGKASVINFGIGGNRILRGTPQSARVGNLFGDAAIKRFETDVFTDAKIDDVILLEGVNDLWHPAEFGLEDEIPTAAQMIDGLKQLVDIAHLNDAKVLGGTILPFMGAENMTSAMDEKREIVNEWIRNSGSFDEVIDFDAVVQDKNRPSHLREDCDSGDHLHPNEKGGMMIASAINLQYFLET